MKFTRHSGDSTTQTEHGKKAKLAQGEDNYKKDRGKEGTLVGQRAEDSREILPPINTKDKRPMDRSSRTLNNSHEPRTRSVNSILSQDAYQIPTKVHNTRRVQGQGEVHADTNDKNVCIAQPILKAASRLGAIAGMRQHQNNLNRILPEREPLPNRQKAIGRRLNIPNILNSPYSLSRLRSSNGNFVSIPHSQQPLSALNGHVNPPERPADSEEKKGDETNEDEDMQHIIPAGPLNNVLPGLMHFFGFVDERAVAAKDLIVKAFIEHPKSLIDCLGHSEGGMVLRIGGIKAQEELIAMGYTIEEVERRLRIRPYGSPPTPGYMKGKIIKKTAVNRGDMVTTTPGRYAPGYYRLVNGNGHSFDPNYEAEMMNDIENDTAEASRLDLKVYPILAGGMLTDDKTTLKRYKRIASEQRYK
jgi:hypothetical protein